MLAIRAFSLSRAFFALLGRQRGITGSAPDSQAFRSGGPHAGGPPPGRGWPRRPPTRQPLRWRRSARTSRGRNGARAKIPDDSGANRRRPSHGHRRRGLGRRRRVRLGIGRGEEGGEAVHAGAGDATQHLIVGDRPGPVSGGAGGLLAGDAQGAALVGVVDVPHPGDGRALALRLGGDVAAHAVLRRPFARHDGELARVGLLRQVLDQSVENAFGRAVDRFEGDGRPLRRRGRDGRLAVGGAGRGGQPERDRRDDARSGRRRALHAATPARLPAAIRINTPDDRPACRWRACRWNVVFAGRTVARCCRPNVPWVASFPRQVQGVNELLTLRKTRRSDQGNRIDVAAVIRLAAVGRAPIAEEALGIGIGAQADILDRRDAGAPMRRAAI